MSRSPPSAATASFNAAAAFDAAEVRHVGRGLTAAIDQTTFNEAAAFDAAEVLANSAAAASAGAAFNEAAAFDAAEVSSGITSLMVAVSPLQ